VSVQLTAEQQLVEDIAGFTHDPLGYALYAFPWGVPGTELEHKRLRQWQRDVLDGIGQRLRTGVVDLGEVIRESTASGHGIGKALANNEPVLTPTGWRPIGGIRVGDTVATVDGSFTRVDGVYPQGRVPLYRVTFDDGSSVLTCAEHQWETTTRSERKHGRSGSVRTTAEIAQSLTFPNGPLRGLNHQVPALSAIRHPTAALAVDPYLLGLWLGDGSSRGRIGVALPEKVAAVAGATGSAGTEDGRENGYTVWQAIPAPSLRELGLFGCRSGDKFIPEQYLHADIGQRTALLQGLLDTDGTIGATGNAITYDTMSPRLADGVAELVRSLGGVARRGTKRATLHGRDYGECHRVYVALPAGVAPFRLPAKANRLRPDWSSGNKTRTLRRYIASVEPAGEGEATCIRVAHPSALFVTRDHIVTHNSALVSMLIKWAMDTREDTRGVITANTEKQLLTKTWPELSKWHRMSLTAHWATLTATAMISNAAGHDKTWRIDAVSWSEHNTEAFAGLHNEGKRLLLVFDEASAIADKVWEVAEGALTDKGTEIIWTVFGNPTRNTGRFRECFRSERWNARQIDSRSVEGVNLIELQGMVDEYGEDSDVVKVRIRGQFPSQSATQFIGEDEITTSQRRELPPAAYQHAARVVGVDVARHGDDASVILKRQGPWTDMPKALRVMDTMVLVEEVVSVIETWKPDAVFIDATGMGWGVVDRLRQLGYSKIIHAVQVGEKAIAEREYVNHRSELWGRHARLDSQRGRAAG